MMKAYGENVPCNSKQTACLPGSSGLHGIPVGILHKFDLALFYLPLSEAELVF